MIEDIVTLRSLNARLEEEKQNLINSASRKQTIIYKQEQQLHEQNLTIENLKKEKEQLELQLKQDTLEHRKQIKNILASAKSTERRLQSSLLDVSEKAIEKITKAIKIIKEMLNVLPKENIEGFYEITEEAEQFLKEVEK